LTILTLKVKIVQYAPALFRYLKIRIDEQRDRMGRFILTGSQSFPLMQGVADSLAERCIWKELENLSIKELENTTGFRAGPAEWTTMEVFGRLS